MPNGRRLAGLLAAFAAGFALAVAGCGDDEDGTGGGTTVPTTVTTEGPELGDTGATATTGPTTTGATTDESETTETDGEDYG